MIPEYDKTKVSDFYSKDCLICSGSRISQNEILSLNKVKTNIEHNKDI